MEREWIIVGFLTILTVTFASLLLYISAYTPESFTEIVRNINGAATVFSAWAWIGSKYFLHKYDYDSPPRRALHIAIIHNMFTLQLHD